MKLSKTIKTMMDYKPLAEELRERAGPPDENQPRINVYQCEFGCHTVTVDVDDGVTPFMIPCQAKSRPDRPIAARYLGKDGKCIGTGKSSFYPKGPRPPWIGEPTHEWYKPETLEGLDDATAEHVRKGGLLMRDRTDREPVYHGDLGPRSGENPPKTEESS